MSRPEMAMIGKVTAGLTHEMKNVLATIKEAGGLMEDILASGGAGDQGTVPHRDKFDRALAAIRTHLARGVEISDRLNRFAHTMDEEEATVEPGEVCELAAFLMRRFAWLKYVDLTAETNRKARPLRTSPTRLILALCACVDHCLDKVEAGGSMVIKATGSRKHSGFEVRYKLGPDEAGDAPRWDGGLPDVDTIWTALEVEVETIDGPEGVGLRLILRR